MSIENDHMVIKVISKMDRDNECISCMMPSEQYLDFFSGNAECDTYYRGKNFYQNQVFRVHIYSITL